MVGGWEWVTLVLLAAAVAAAGMAMGRYGLRGRYRVLVGLHSLVRDPEAEPEQEAPSGRGRSGSPGMRRLLRRTGRQLLHGGVQRWAEACLRGTGLPLRPEEFVVVEVGMLALGALLAATLPIALFPRLCILATAAFGPPLFAGRARSRRSQRVSTQLGDVLMTLGNGLRAGHSLMQALDNAAAQSADPLGPEISRLLREVGGGIPMEEALQRLLARTANPDLELLVTAVLVQREVGGNLAEILDKIASTIRSRVAVQNHLRVITAQSRLSGWVVGLLPVAVFGITTLIAPQVEKTLTHDPIGRIVAIAAILLEVMGLLAIRQIVAVKY